MSRKSAAPVAPDSFEEIDRMVHEPARIWLMATLMVLDEADFTYLQTQTGMTRGNLGSHMAKLQTAGYVTVEKTYRDQTPRTVFSLTSNGRSAITQWRDQMAGVVAMLSVD